MEREVNVRLYQRNPSERRMLVLSWLVAALLLPVVATSVRAADPWAPSQLIQAPELAAHLKESNKPVILQVGVKRLFEQARIPGAKFCGSGSSPKGLEELKKCVESLPRSAEIILYCGCCPMKDCPNLRPAFEVLYKMNFTHVKVLDIPHNFGKDWVDEGFPTEPKR
jgi:thiosulfate/3-mercaptopyruvate sulfurtransferase